MKKALHLSLKTTNILLTIVILIILPIVVFTLISSKTSTLGGIQSFVVLTGSMQPTIPQGSIIYTKKQPWYPEGSIIAFKKGDTTVTHRVAKVINKNNVLEYQTKGDANNTKDIEIITGSDILGKQVFSIPYLGRLIVFLKNPQGFLSFIVFPIIVFIVLELWNMKKEIERQIEAKVMKKMEIQTLNQA